MSAFFPLHEVGVPYPDTTVLKRIASRLGGDDGKLVLFNGGWLSDMLTLGHNNGTGDIDAIMMLKDFFALKPKEKGLPDVRQHFNLHKPNFLRLLHQIDEGTLEEDPRVVGVIEPQYLPEWDLPRPLGLNLQRHPVDPHKVVADTDFAFRQVISDGHQIWVTEGFVEDRANRTLTLRHGLDAVGYERSMRRLAGFRADRYAGWTPLIPVEYQQFVVQPYQQFAVPPA